MHVTPPPTPVIFVVGLRAQLPIQGSLVAMRPAAAGTIATDDSSLYANGEPVLITAGLLICKLVVICHRHGNGL